MAVAAGRYPTGSEARQAVLCSAANRGWTLADVTTRIDDRRWAGLRQLYTRYRTGRQRALARDWNKALSRAVRKSAGPVSTSDTSPNTHRGTRGTTERDQISKEWISVFLDAATNASPRWGRNAGRNRALLQSLAYAASHTGSRVIDWGVRSYGLGAGLGRSTAADVLRALAGEDDPFLTRVAGGVYDQADTYRGCGCPTPCPCAVAAPASNPGPSPTCSSTGPNPASASTRR